MKEKVANILRFIVPIAVEFASIAFATIFVLASQAMLFYLIVVLVLAFLIRIKKLGKAPKAVFYTLYGFIMLFTLNGISVLWGFLINASKPLFALYILLVCASGLVLYKVSILGLRWYHGCLASAVFILAILTASLSLQVSIPAEERERSEGFTTKDVELLINYRYKFGNSRGNPIPRHFELDPEEKVLFICNRLNAPHYYGSLLTYELGTGKLNFVDLSKLTAMDMEFDQSTDSLAVIAYRETTPKERRSSRDAALFWIDRDGNVIDSVQINQRLSLYTLIRVRKDSIEIMYRRTLGIYDRNTKYVQQRLIPVPSLMTGAVNFLELKDRIILCSGGSIISTLLIPTLCLLDDNMTSLIAGRRLPLGPYVLDYDHKKEEIYTNPLWSGTLWVYDKDLNLLRKIKLAKVIRAIAIDSERRRGYAADYITGDIIAFNLDTGEKLGSINIGKGARALKLAKNGDLYAGSRLGVFRISLGAWDQPSVKQNL